MDAYFKVILHDLEKQGVDLWWLDWQQNDQSVMKNVDPLWILNHYHFLDHGKDGRRAMTLSRYAGPGSHRYPLGFSGVSVNASEEDDKLTHIGPRDDLGFTQLPTRVHRHGVQYRLRMVES